MKPNNKDLSEKNINVLQPDNSVDETKYKQKLIQKKLEEFLGEFEKGKDKSELLEKYTDIISKIAGIKEKTAKYMVENDLFDVKDNIEYLLKKHSVELLEKLSNYITVNQPFLNDKLVDLNVAIPNIINSIVMYGKGEIKIDDVISTFKTELGNEDLIYETTQKIDTAADMINGNKDYNIEISLKNVNIDVISKYVTAHSNSMYKYLPSNTLPEIELKTMLRIYKVPRNNIYVIVKYVKRIEDDTYAVYRMKIPTNCYTKDKVKEILANCIHIDINGIQQLDGLAVNGIPSNLQDKIIIEPYITSMMIPEFLNMLIDKIRSNVLNTYSQNYAKSFVIGVPMPTEPDIFKHYVSRQLSDGSIIDEYTPLTKIRIEPLYDAGYNIFAVVDIVNTDAYAITINEKPLSIIVNDKDISEKNEVYISTVYIPSKVVDDIISEMMRDTVTSEGTKKSCMKVWIKHELYSLFGSKRLKNKWHLVIDEITIKTIKENTTTELYNKIIDLLSIIQKALLVSAKKG